MKVALLVDRASLRATAPSEDLRRTVADVAGVLRRGGHEVSIAYPQSLSRLKRLRPDVVFNLCEGIDGDANREAEAAGAVERIGLRLTGNPSRALRTALDKARAKEILRRARLRVPRDGRFPAIVKPRRADASIGIDRGSIVNSWPEARRRAARVKGETIVEEFIDGREFNVSLLGDRVLAISEIDFRNLPASMPRIVTYDGKWKMRSAEYRGTAPVCPARVGASLARRLRATSRRASRTLGCRGPVRVDLRVDPRGHVFVLEVNPNPDLSRGAGFARAAKARGWSYEELIERILRED